MNPALRRRLLLLGALVVLALGFQGLRGLWEPDEGRYVDVAWEMLRTGDWLEPRLHHEQPHWTKPPLTYWALASSLALFGTNTFAARLPLALAYLFTVLATHSLARELAPGRRFAAALVQATALMSFASSSVVTTDGVLTLFETLAALGFVRALLGSGRERGPWLLVGWAAVGLGFLTKGPPALLVLLPVFLLRLVGVGRGKDLLRWELAGLATALALAAPWFLVVISRHPGLVEYFLEDEVAARVLSDAHDRNAGWTGPFKAYWGVVLFGPLPWTWPLLRGARRAWQDLRARGRQADPAALFLLAWIALPALVLLLSQSRQPLYALPFFVPASLLAARALGAAWEHPWRSRRHAVLVGAWLAALLGLRLVVGLLPADRDARAFARRVEAAAPGPWGEVVFVTTRPYWGASLYLGAEVESVGREGVESLASELSEPEAPRLFVVKAADEERFLAAAAQAGRSLRPRGRVEGWQDYRLHSDESP